MLNETNSSTVRLVSQQSLAASTSEHFKCEGVCFFLSGGRPYAFRSCGRHLGGETSETHRCVGEAHRMLACNFICKAIFNRSPHCLFTLLNNRKPLCPCSTVGNTQVTALKHYGKQSMTSSGQGSVCKGQLPFENVKVYVKLFKGRHGQDQGNRVGQA